MPSYQEIESLTRRLVEIPSASGKTTESIMALNLVSEYLGPDFGELTFESRKSKKDPVIVSRIWGDKDSLMRPKLLLCGHIDVVPAESKLFVPRKEGDRLYGRGSYDMKGQVAAMVESFKHWSAEFGPRNVSLFLTSDEELGGTQGTKYVIGQGLKTEVVFIPDGDSKFDIITSQKAPHHFKIVATGVGGHASRAFELDNPVNRIWGLYQKMRERYAIATSQNPWESTFEMTVINTPVNAAPNAIPETIDTWFSWRWPPELYNFQEGVNYLNELLPQYGCKIIDQHGWGEGCFCHPDEPFVQKWKKSIEEVLGREVGFAHMHGATDGRHFFKEGVKVLVTSVTGGNPHSTDEWVDIPSLVQLSKAVSQYQTVI